MTWWHYLLLSNLYLILFFGFYALLLQRETFFQLNRIYLVGASVISFFIPLIQLDVVKSWFITQKVHQTIYSASPQAIYTFNNQPDQLTMGEIARVVYIAGIVILSVKLLWQLFALKRMIVNRQLPAAWSFFKKIKVDEELEGQEVIIAHEEVHARQWHSADVLLIELVMIINWFNPIVYLYRYYIKQTHEFIADRDALKTGTSKADYAMLLLNQAFNAPSHHLLNPFFNSSVLKKRIMMLQKNKSGYVALLKYGFSAPLFALMLALSSATINNSEVVKTIKREALQVFEAPAPVLINAPVVTEELTVKQPRTEELVASVPEFKVNNELLVKDNPTAKVVDEPIVKDSLHINEAKEIFTAVEKLPNFVGGVRGFAEFLQKNLHNTNGNQGRVNVTFVVRKDGELTDVRALKASTPALAEEAVRVIASSPKWAPGEQNGKKVDVQYTVPVVFGATARYEADTSAKRVVQTINFVRRGDVKIKGAVDTFKVTSRFSTNNNEAVVTGFSVKQGSKPLVIVDGKETDVAALKTMDAKTIASINVLREDAAVKAYGKKHENGVIMVTTKPMKNQ
ncbi:TonB family protein [Mucilaginibacter terrae]|uniref:TonB family protein n=1 Tax=Mucilaginibacter terrae TaxID=1955052 RepID=A0ABU3GUP5_9SPHI|nr:TonB family protein [Mucilaginibacter terrae]MDT3403494.1 TonB family protein [Mucilaginibacter terrae]